MKILTIGNSFSEDATRYLHEIAAAAGEDFEIDCQSRYRRLLA